MWSRLHQMLIKEFIQLLRDKRMRPVVFVMPVIQLLVFSFAVNTDVDHIATAIFDQDNSASSRDLVSAFLDSGYFERTLVVDTPAEVHRVMDGGAVQAVLYLPRQFEGELKAGRSPAVQLLVDGTNSNTASIVLSYSQEIVSRFSQSWLAEMGGGVLVEPVRLETRGWVNPILESRNFFVPGVIGLIVTVIVLLLTSMAVVREKEIGTIEQILVSPIRPIEFILGKTIPFTVIGYIDMALVTVVGVAVFDVPFKGSAWMLVLGTGAYLLTILGLGLFISTISQTQQQAMLTMFFFLMPAVLLSGFMFPIENMPAVVQWMTVVNPMRYYMELIRGIFLKGLGPAILWRQLACLAGMGVLVMLLSVSRFRKTLA